MIKVNKKLINRTFFSKKTECLCLVFLFLRKQKFFLFTVTFFLFFRQTINSGTFFTKNKQASISYS